MIKRRSRRMLLKAIAVGAAMMAIPLWARADSVSVAQPNIVFLFSDDHACQAISAYGSKINKTPNIDRIAQEGAIFLNNFCANSICAPSRACILTGKHSHMNGQLTNHDRFDGDQQTFPKLLQKTGYVTGLFGKWHLKSKPTGFDEWMIYPGQGNYYNPDFITPEGKKRINGYSVEVTTDRALDFLKRHKDEKPFLLMCQYKAPHREWLPGPKYLTKYDGTIIPEPESLFDNYEGRANVAARHKMGIDRHMAMTFDLMYPSTAARDWKRMTHEQQQIWKAAFDADNSKSDPAQLSGKDLVRWKYQRYIKNYLRCVAAVDDNVGRILDYLSKSGLDKDTIVIYSSDQGFYLGEHGWFDKRWMYEESFRMPLVVRWPGKVKPGTKLDQLTQNIDFAPSLLQAVGATVPEEMQGRSFMPLLSGKKVDWRESLYYHYYEHGGHGVPRHYGVRTAHHKLVHYYETDEWELFDLTNDPQEMTSVYNNPEYVKIRKNIEKELDRLRHLYRVPNDKYETALLPNSTRTMGARGDRSDASNGQSSRR